MSGGVDSSVAATLLLREGYDVVGVFMRLGSPGESIDELQPVDEPVCRTPIEDTARRAVPPKLGHQGCCSVSDAADARLVAAKLGVPFYVVNFKKDFGRIMDYFAAEYAAGRTPNPCVRCNDWLKFGKLHEYAKQIDADFVASGHYARVEANGTRLMRGLDADKDQSYVLFGVPRDQLSHMMLPIGGLRKPRVRELAHEFGLPVFNKPDSQEICFVPDNDYAGFVEKRRPELAAAQTGGEVLDPDGKVVGRHAGQHRFTIGQRRGVGVALGYPVFVVGKNPAESTVTIGPREMLMSSQCEAGEANWLTDPPPPGQWRKCMAKYRYNTDAVAAEFAVHASPSALAEGVAESARPGEAHPSYSGRTGRFQVRFEQPQEAVTPGQAIVLYDRAEPEWVLGGGWIENSVVG